MRPGSMKARFIDVALLFTGDECLNKEKGITVIETKQRMGFACWGEAGNYMEHFCWYMALVLSGW